MMRQAQYPVRTMTFVDQDGTPLTSPTESKPADSSSNLLAS
jgi:hypothetical protein